ncbi:hypothetical protein NECAME_07862 [Necator americanus]|uniref:Uncharacterized protein n=1 Tax=Necator americanus TaxID=51031 RepID=W2TLE9_NECAM|nr:hypothetical protein NECAME_07862 [Necator americanus]ETN82608.1 hypothetical protein NECAME_07862 [Necator americanus]
MSATIVDLVYPRFWRQLEIGAMTEDSKSRLLSRVPVTDAFTTKAAKKAAAQANQSLGKIGEKMSENAATPPEAIFRLGNGVELPPFRTVSDFILGKARFEDLALGLAAIVVVAAVVIFAISDNPSFYQTRRDHPLLTLGAIIVACYFFIQVLPSVLTVLFRLGLRTTVMGRILETCGITVKA